MPANTTLKQRFLTAIIAGKIGTPVDGEIIVTQKKFKVYFKKEITTEYITSFLPAATIEKGRTSASHTRFVFRLSQGVYRVHADAIDEAVEMIIKAHIKRDDGGSDGGNDDENEAEAEVKECRGRYG